MLLSMIAGAQEIPHAWGLAKGRVALPKVRRPPGRLTRQTDPLAERRENLQRLPIAGVALCGPARRANPGQRGRSLKRRGRSVGSPGRGRHALFLCRRLEGRRAADLLVCEPAVHGNEAA